MCGKKTPEKSKVKLPEEEAAESNQKRVQDHHIYYPTPTPRLKKPGCAMELAIFERHGKNCKHKKKPGPDRDPLDSQGSFYIIGRVGYEYCSRPCNGGAQQGMSNFPLSSPSYTGDLDETADQVGDLQSVSKTMRSRSKVKSSQENFGSPDTYRSKSSNKSRNATGASDYGLADLFKSQNRSAAPRSQNYDQTRYSGLPEMFKSNLSAKNISSPNGAKKRTSFNRPDYGFSDIYKTRAHNESKSNKDLSEYGLPELFKSKTGATMISKEPVVEKHYDPETEESTVVINSPSGNLQVINSPTETTIVIESSSEGNTPNVTKNPSMGVSQVESTTNAERAESKIYDITAKDPVGQLSTTCKDAWANKNQGSQISKKPSKDIEPTLNTTQDGTNSPMAVNSSLLKTSNSKNNNSTIRHTVVRDPSGVVTKKTSIDFTAEDETITFEIEDSNPRTSVIHIDKSENDSSNASKTSQTNRKGKSNLSMSPSRTPPTRTISKT